MSLNMWDIGTRTEKTFNNRHFLVVMRSQRSDFVTPFVRPFIHHTLFLSFSITLKYIQVVMGAYNMHEQTKMKISQDPSKLMIENKFAPRPPSQTEIKDKLKMKMTPDPPLRNIPFQNLENNGTLLTEDREQVGREKKI